jgi:hypothetical protein
VTPVPHAAFVSQLLLKLAAHGIDAIGHTLQLHQPASRQAPSQRWVRALGLPDLPFSVQLWSIHDLGCHPSTVDGWV